MSAGLALLANYSDDENSEDEETKSVERVMKLKDVYQYKYF